MRGNFIGVSSKMWSERMRSVLRVVAALLFMSHGLQKMAGFPLAQKAPFHLFTLTGVAGTLEAVGGALLLLGLFTRPVAFVLSGEMAFAYFLAHAPRGFWPLGNGGELAAIYCFLFLYFAFVGGGAWSVDRWWADRTRAAASAPARLEARAGR